MTKAYYNENDKHAAQYLRNLIRAGAIAPGDVDDRDIRDVCPRELDGYDQHHFFAGIGIWSLALRQAGWPDDRPAWTGSCPCQPFSQAGKSRGFDDERHLWPAWHWLVTQCNPAIIFGEQVASPLGRAWIDLVFADMEGLGYACGAALLCSAGVGAPNERHRNYWLADSRCSSDELWCRSGKAPSEARPAERKARQQQRRGLTADDGCATGGVGNAGNARLSHAEPRQVVGAGRREEGRATTESGSPHDPWRELEWIACRDGKMRPTQPGLFPLASRNPGDVGILRAAGNAINPYVAEAFIRAYTGNF